ncbi:prolipoprotein diacylglyceryl transferase [Pelagibacteraceae bacterium]|nr:prolipoprotein diacylglyceryl transferase [Pelagibacteraceae bacterium]
MYTHNLDPILFDFGFLIVRWYSLAYIFGILIGWWLGKKIILKRFYNSNFNFDIKEFDNLITYLIVAIILGGRIGYILFYNLGYYITNPFEIFKIWEGGMSFHGALIGIVVGTYFFSIKRNIKIFFLLDILACVSPVGIFFGRIANFINGELIGKTTDVYWSVIFPNIDNVARHPSQLYEAFLEGILLLILMNLIIFKKNYKIGTCSFMFLIFYGLFRIISEFFREPDAQIGYLFNIVSMGMFLSALMIATGIIIFLRKRNDN